MSRNISIDNGYYFGKTAFSKDEKIYKPKSKYDLNINEGTIRDKDQITFSSILPNDIDIFNELPQYVYENKDAKLFLDVLRKALLNTDLEGITLSKLCVSDHSDSEMVIDWIYNYFRIYFSFDSENGNFYGIISSNPEENSYSNYFKAMNTKDYEVLAKFIVDYVVIMINT